MVEVVFPLAEPEVVGDTPALEARVMVLDFEYHPSAF